MDKIGFIGLGNMGLPMAVNLKNQALEVKAYDLSEEAKVKAIQSGIEVKNIGQCAYDDGHGVIRGVCQGTINYETGAITLTNAPVNANFVFSANYGSSQNGGNRFGTNDGNSISSIAARSCNSKVDTTIEIIGLK